MANVLLIQTSFQGNPGQYIITDTYWNTDTKTIISVPGGQSSTPVFYNKPYGELVDYYINGLSRIKVYHIGDANVVMEFIDIITKERMQTLVRNKGGWVNPCEVETYFRGGGTWNKLQDNTLFSIGDKRWLDFRCDECYKKYSGFNATEFDIDFGTTIGEASMIVGTFWTTTKFEVWYNGSKVADSGYLGLEAADTNHENTTLPGFKILTFNKNTTSKTVTVKVIRDSTFSEWTVQSNCPNIKIPSAKLNVYNRRYSPLTYFFKFTDVTYFDPNTGYEYTANLGTRDDNLFLDILQGTVTFGKGLDDTNTYLNMILSKGGSTLWVFNATNSNRSFDYEITEGTYTLELY